MKRILAPSILAADFARLGEAVGAVTAAGAEYVHIDIMDGVFVPSISLGIPVVSSIRGCTNAIFDVHLMIISPIHYVAAFAEAGADIITFHLEACEDDAAVRETIQAIRRGGCRVGISIKPNTPLSALFPYLDSVDMILLMSVEPGFGGQQYISGSTERIRRLRHILTERGLDTDIEVDGGIKTENVGTVLTAGANVIVAGTAVFKGNISENVHTFLNIFRNTTD